MKKLTPQEIWPLPIYERLREDFRRQVIAYKKLRRIDVGPSMTFVFEDRTTVKFQIQEILRAEQSSTPDGITKALEDFNPLIPPDGHLSATLLISASSPEDVSTRFSSLLGLRECVSLQVGGEVITANFEPLREGAETIRAVQHLDFAFTQKAKQLLSTELCTLRVQHPSYVFEATLPKEMSDSLRQDLYAQG